MRSFMFCVLFSFLVYLYLFIVVGIFFQLFIWIMTQYWWILFCYYFLYNLLNFWMQCWFISCCQYLLLCLYVLTYIQVFNLLTECLNTRIPHFLWLPLLTLPILYFISKKIIRNITVKYFRFFQSRYLIL